MTARILLTAALSIATLAGTPATAALHQTPQTASIAIHDLNLSTIADQQRLNRRIGNVARSLCVTGERTVAARVAAQQCIAAVRDSAQPQVARAIASATSDLRLAAIVVSVDVG